LPALARVARAGISRSERSTEPTTVFTDKPSERGDWRCLSEGRGPHDADFASWGGVVREFAER